MISLKSYLHLVNFFSLYDALDITVVNLQSAKEASLSLSDFYLANHVSEKSLGVFPPEQRSRPLGVNNHIRYRRQLRINRSFLFFLFFILPQAVLLFSSC